MLARSLASSVLVVSLVACNNASEEDESFDYGRDDVRAAIEGTWEGTSSSTGGAATPVTLTLAYATADAQTLCGNRILSGAVAPRCMDISTMNVSGTFTSETVSARNQAFRGSFGVYSLRFAGQGELSAEIDGKRLGGSLSNDVLEGTLTGQAGEVLISFSLRRRP
ncbi:MAG: hypothetical protein K0S65_4402 [Labilithrix sp.]|nr:hypothetical protein [Labilithrix sp.]